MVKKFFNRKYLPIYLIIILALVSRLILAFDMPFYAPPDEIRRMHILESIYYDNHVPVYGVETNHFTVIQPFLGYQLNAYFAKILPFDIPLFIKFRIGSILWSIIAIYYAFLISKKIFPKSKIEQICITATFALWPQFIYVGSYINIDAFAIMAATISLFYIIDAYIRQNVSYLDSFKIGTSLGLVFLSKENAYVIFILAFILLIKFLFKKFKELLVLFFTFLVFPLIFYLRNYFIYGKFYIFLQGAVPENSSIRESIMKLDGIDYPTEIITLKEIFTDPYFFTLLFKSFFAVFGHMTVFLHNFFYLLLFVFILFSSVGLIKYLISIKFKNNKSKYLLWLSLFVVIVILMLAIIRQNVITFFQPQGRYLLPLLMPILLLNYIGISFIFYGIKKFLLILFTIFVVFSGLYSFFIII